MVEAQRTRFEVLMDEAEIRGDRRTLRRMAAKRFDTETAERFAEHLDSTDDPERLTELGEFIVECETAEELLARARNMDRSA